MRAGRRAGGWAEGQAGRQSAPAGYDQHLPAVAGSACCRSYSTAGCAPDLPGCLVSCLAAWWSGQLPDCFIFFACLHGRVPASLAACLAQSLPGCLSAWLPPLAIWHARHPAPFCRPAYVHRFPCRGRLSIGRL